MKIERLLLACGIVFPFIYFSGQAAGLALNPDQDIATRQPSELGCCGARLTLVANASFILSGLAACLGALGLFIGLRSLGGNLVFAALAGLGLALLGVALAMAGLFPLPNPLHYGFGLLLAGLLTPLFGALALRGGGARWLLLVGFVLSVAIALTSQGVGDLITEGNVGWFARGLALVAFSTIAYLCWEVIRRTKATGAG